LAHQTHLNVHLLGQSFHLETAEQEDRFAAWWGSIIRCTYREGFLPMYRRVEGTEDHIKITSDAGWGCMIRVGQMVLMRALMRHHGIEPGEDLEADVLMRTSPTGVRVSQLVELFHDDPNFSRCPLSLYAFVTAAGGGDPWAQLYDSAAAGFSSEELHGVPQKRPGDWFGPTSVSLTAQRLLSRGLPLADFSVVVETDGQVYVDEVERASEGWARNVLLLLALKLGHGEVAPAALEGILRCLELPSSLGVLGGRPRRAHFFVGKCENGELLYLDPHRVQAAATDVASLATFRNADAPPLLPVQGIDSSVSCAFFLRSASDLETLVAALPETPFAIAKGPRPKWSLAPVDAMQADDPFILL
jgi:cysteine protease ATG4